MSSKNTSQNTPSSKSTKSTDFKEAVAPVTGNLLSDNDSETSGNAIPWTNFFYKIWWNIRRLFINPFCEQKKELRLLDQVELLISEGDAGSVAETCEKYITLHRIVENTRARRRLERWVTRLIVFYLLMVFILLSTNSLHSWLETKGLPFIYMDEKIIIALLTTTTINIVALGIILVRGLFHEDEDKDVGKEKPLSKKAVE